MSRTRELASRIPQERRCRCGRRLHPTNACGQCVYCQRRPRPRRRHLSNHDAYLADLEQMQADCRDKDMAFRREMRLAIRLWYRAQRRAGVTTRT